MENLRSRPASSFPEFPTLSGQVWFVSHSTRLIPLPLNGFIQRRWPLALLASCLTASIHHVFCLLDTCMPQHTSQGHSASLGVWRAQLWDP